MRIKTLKISGYKNLKNTIINFEKTDGVAVLMGANGSGKSNILEAISYIYSGFYQNNNPIMDFNLNMLYEINNEKVAFIKATGYVKAIVDSLDNCVDFNTFTSNRDYYLPSRIITIYSGEDKRLWNNIYKKHYDDYNSSIIANNTPVTNLKMQYINKYHWSIGLILIIVYKPDLLSRIGIKVISEIGFDINNKNLKKFSTNSVTSFVNSIVNNYGKIGDSHVKISVKDFRIFAENFFPNANELFNILCIALLPIEDKLINDVDFVTSNIEVLSALSEGEKKLILLNVVYELLVDNNSLVLLDEPDAHIHEGRKEEIKEVVSRYTDLGVCTVMTSHSPTMTKLFDDKHIIMLKSLKDSVKQISTNKIEVVKQLTNDEWTLTDTNIFLNSSKPILLVEGKTDIMFIRKAIKVFSSEKTMQSEFKIITDLYYLTFGGKGNAKFVYEEIKKLSNKRKIIILFDNEGTSKNQLHNDFNANIEELNVNSFSRVENDIFMVLPKLDTVTGDFSIEDYLKKDYLLTLIDAEKNAATFKSFSSIPKIKDNIKKLVSEKIHDLGFDDLRNFELLLTKLIEVIEV